MIKSMNEKRKSEGELIEAVFLDYRSRAQKLLDRCKERERLLKCRIVRVDRFTWYIIPEKATI